MDQYVNYMSKTQLILNQLCLGQEAKLNRWFNCTCYLAPFKPNSYETDTEELNTKLLTLTIQGGTEDKPLSGGNARLVPWSKFRYFIRRVIIKGKIVFDEKHTNLSGLFHYCGELEEIIGLENLDTTNVTDMSQMFRRCKKLTRLNLLNLNTSNVTNMTEMFDRCKSLTELDLSNFNTRNVIYMTRMFNKCKQLTQLNTCNFNTRNVDIMEGMFSNCSSLTELDLNHFDMLKLRHFSYMFENCTSLIKVNFPKRYKFNHWFIKGMYRNCSSLKSVDLSMFHFAPFEARGLLYNCNQLESVKFTVTIDVSSSLKYIYNYNGYD